MDACRGKFNVGSKMEIITQAAHPIVMSVKESIYGAMEMNTQVNLLTA